MEKLIYPSDERIITKTALDSGYIMGCEDNGQPIQFPYSLFTGGGGGSILAFFWNQQTQGTNGGALTAASWTIRTITNIYDPLSMGLSLASNILTLPIGLYMIDVRCNQFVATSASARLALYDEDASSYILPTGKSRQINNNGEWILSDIFHFNATSEANISLHHYSSAGHSKGQGLAQNLSGFDELFLMGCITKLS